jgi:DNA-binding NtrC family response regulator
MAQVLVIERDEGIRAALCALLELDGHAVTVMENPASAIERLLTCAKHMVVLFDAGVPGVRDGQLIALASAADARLLRHAYICMTTVPAKIHPDLQSSLTRQLVPILTKPFDIDRVLALVAQQEETAVAGTCQENRIPAGSAARWWIDLSAIEHGTMRHLASAWDRVEVSRSILRASRRRITRKCDDSRRAASYVASGA